MKRIVLSLAAVTACSIPDKVPGEIDGAVAPTDAATDADPAPPATAPPRLFPWNGYATGSIHDVTDNAAGTGLPRRPRFRWEPVAGATHYRFEWRTGCTNGSIAACDFSAAEFAVVTTTSFRSTTDMTQNLTMPVGARIFWRVKACSSETSCGPASPIRYLDVGRRSDDLNGDGYGDLVVGAVYAGAGTSGRAFVWYGGSGGLASGTPEQVYEPDSDMDNELGYGVAYGDLNGDGFSDLAVGAPLNGGDDRGAVCVYMGSLSGIPTASGVGCARTSGPGSGFGYNVTIGDLDGNGFADLTVSATAEGKLWTFAGESVTPSLTGTSIDTPGPGNFAFGLDATGDVNGDGYVDLIAGAASSAGRAYVFNGGPAGASTAPSNTLAPPPNPPDTCAQFGFSIDAGDVDGDGYADAAIGCDSGSAHGRVYLFRGGTTGLATTPHQVLANPLSTAGASAFCRASLGDIDGDGDEDLVVGAYNNDIASGNEGLAYVYRFDAGTLANRQNLVSPAPQQDAQFGSSVDLNHDFNGDGRADLAISASGHTGTEVGEGRVYIFPTSTTGQVESGSASPRENPAHEPGGAFGVNLRH